jgi:hypothetical protein
MQSNFIEFFSAKQVTKKCEKNTKVTKKLGWMLRKKIQKFRKLTIKIWTLGAYSQHLIFFVTWELAEKAGKAGKWITV